MSFYEGVKESVKNEDTETPDDEESPDKPADAGGEDMPFDQLKKEAEQNAEKQSDKPDETKIEVLTDDGSSSTPDKTPSKPSSTPEKEVPEQQSQNDAADPTAVTENKALDEVVGALQRIEQQNEEIAGILRGIKRSLDNN